MLGAEPASGLLDVFVGLQPFVLVPEHAARIVVDDDAQGRQLRAQPHDLVDLLLVLRHDHADLGVVPDEGKLLGDGVLVHGHGHAAQALDAIRTLVEGGLGEDIGGGAH